MNDDDVLKRYIHETIAAAEAKTKAESSDSDEEFKSFMRNSAEKLKPVVAALAVVKTEVTTKGIEISTEPHYPTMTLNGRGGYCHQLTFQTNYPDCGDYFVLEEDFTIGGYSENESHFFDSPEEVLSFVLSRIGKHIADHKS